MKIKDIPEEQILTENKGNKYTLVQYVDNPTTQAFTVVKIPNEAPLLEGVKEYSFNEYHKVPKIYRNGKLLWEKNQ